MDIIRSLIFFFVAIIVLVGFHEFGHFIVARLCGVKVLRFSLGFGKVIYSHTGKDGCEYALSLIPLGGYVKMLDKREGVVDEKDLSQEFSTQIVWKRLAIVAAGPIFNIVLAFVLYYVTFLMGVSAIKPYVTAVEEQSISWNAGLRNNDLILKIADNETIDWEDASYEFIQQIGESSVPVQVKHENGRIQDLTLDLSNWSIRRDQPGQLFEPLGFTPKYFEFTKRVGLVLPDSPAFKAGLKEGDEMVAINGEPITNWHTFTRFVAAHPEEEIEFTINRPNIPKSSEEKKTDKVDEESDYGEKFFAKFPSTPMTFKIKLANAGTIEEPKGQIGISVMVDRLSHGERFVRQYGIFEAIPKSIEKMVSVCKLTVVTIGKLVNGSIAANNISGPIAIAKSAGITATIGIEYFLAFMALISINLGIMNLIPLPVLDGGHIMFYLIEAVCGRPVPDKVMQGLMYFGVFVLLLLMTFAVYNDIVFDGF